MRLGHSHHTFLPSEEVQQQDSHELSKALKYLLRVFSTS